MKAVVLPMRDARAMEKVDRFMVGVLVNRVRLLCRLTVNGRVMYCVLKRKEKGRGRDVRNMKRYCFSYSYRLPVTIFHLS